MVSVHLHIPAWVNSSKPVTGGFAAGGRYQSIATWHAPTRHSQETLLNTDLLIQILVLFIYGMTTDDGADYMNSSGFSRKAPMSKISIRNTPLTK